MENVTSPVQVGDGSLSVTESAECPGPPVLPLADGSGVAISHAGPLAIVDGGGHPGGAPGPLAGAAMSSAGPMVPGPPDVGAAAPSASDLGSAVDGDGSDDDAELEVADQRVREMQLALHRKREATA